MPLDLVVAYWRNFEVSYRTQAVSCDMDPHELEDCLVKQKLCLGVARIDLAALTFSHPLSGQHREVSEKSIRRLLQIFKIEGCHNIRDEHLLNVVIDRAHLDAALAEIGLGSGAYSTLTRDRTGNLPFLPVSHASCLHGLHRARAAQRFLDEDDQWWGVRLFTDGIGNHVNMLCYPAHAPQTSLLRLPGRWSRNTRTPRPTLTEKSSGGSAPTIAAMTRLPSDRGGRGLAPPRGKTCSSSCGTGPSQTRLIGCWICRVCGDRFN